MSFANVISLFKDLREQSGLFDVSLIVDDGFEWDRKRGFAYCEVLDSGYAQIAVNPRLETQSPQRIEGVLMHEMGHAHLLLTGNDRHTERDADTDAARMFGKTINYDKDDVQTTGEGISPRPSHLDDEKGCTRG